jgi:uncharacterized protein YfaS (alpha-2-macroglobulin family)
VLILQKELLLAQGKEFTKEKKIKKLLKKLSKNQHENGSWGWFNQTNSNYFITAYITQTLQWIAKRGYDVQGITSAKKYLATAFLATNHKGKRINNSLYNLSVLSELGLGKEYQVSDLMEYEPSLYTEILWLKIKQNRQQEISLKPILDQSSQTYFGGRFWGRYESTGWNNSIQLNIWMYHILHNAEEHKKECEEIVNYFLEKRKKSWRNTMESAQILEILLQENDINQESLEVLVNNQAIEVPYKQLINSADSIQVTKKGRGKIFFTTYETTWNSTPQRVDSILSVYTHFEDQKGSPITTLKAGEMVTLVAEIDLPKAGEYWMFNVPIPSSCAYYGKPSARGSEIHREYFKDRVSVFYESLSNGKYRIEIPLQVRFEGNVNLNPAKMEMMYFPTFYGRNTIKQIQSK